MDHQTHRRFKNDLYAQFARISRALANAHRLELLDLLAQGERSVEDLARETDMSVASTSQHLQALRAARLVETRRDGLYIFYRLADESVYNAWRALRELGESRLSEVQQVVRTYLHERESMQPLSADDLKAKLRDNAVLLLDVRPESEYNAGHIRGARSLPVSEFHKRLKEIPRHREIVAYCRGPYCVFADEAVSFLRAKGYRAHRLEQGFPEWQTDGLPVERAVTPEHA